MTIGFRGSRTATANNGGNISVDLTALLDTSGATVSVQNGDFVVLTYTIGATFDRTMGESTGVLTMDAELYSNGTSFDANVAIFTGLWTTGEATTLTLLGSGSLSDAGACSVIVFTTDTALSATVTTATGTGTGRPTPPAVTPTVAGSWIVCCGGASAGTGAVFTNPGDLSATTNHYRSVVNSDTNDAMSGIGIKTNWASGTFTPSQWTGGTTNAADAWAAGTVVLAPVTATPRSQGFIF